MRLVLPTSEQAPHVLRAFKTIASLTGSPGERQQAMLDAATRLLGVDLDPSALEPITPPQLAAAIDDPQIRAQIVQGMVVLDLVDEEAEARAVEAIEAFAQAMDVSPAELRNLRQIVEGQTLRLRLDVARRVWFVDRLAKAWKEGGFRWLVRTLATLEIMDHPALANRYRALGELPEGSMGRCYHDHIREQGFPLPGEKGSQVEPIVIHDLTHLLSGYGTDPAGEVLTAAFSAGNRRKEPFTYIFFVLCQFHLGMRFSPFAPASTGRFDPQAVLRAVERGIKVKVDLTEEWDYWADMTTPLEEVRDKLGVTPLTE